MQNSRPVFFIKTSTDLKVYFTLTSEKKLLQPGY